MVTWRALLADGTVAVEDGVRSHEQFLDRIIEFQLIDGHSIVVRVQPDRGERVVYRRRPTLRMDGSPPVVAHIVGLMSREHGLAFLTEYGEDGVLKIGMVEQIEFTAAELA